MHVEVINLGMTAVNSYVINDLAKHVENLNPDVIIIYAGHNEYYGSFGVGSTQNNIGTSIRTKRLILWLKDFLVYQFIEDLLGTERAIYGCSTNVNGKGRKRVEYKKGQRYF